MNRWKRQKRRTDWTRPRAYKKNGGATVALVMTGAVAAGLLGGKVWQTGAVPVEAVSASAIEWNVVQAVPRRTPDAQDLAWEKRSRELGDSSVMFDQPATSRAPFGYCYQGGGTNCVVDGDTFYLNGEKVRIARIDAPETHPPRCDYEARLGEAATRKLNALLNSGSVTMSTIERDRDIYGRLLRDVQVNGEDVGEAMISAGVARSYGSGRRPWC